MSVGSLTMDSEQYAEVRAGLDPTVEFGSPIRTGEPQDPPENLPVPIPPQEGISADSYRDEMHKTNDDVPKEMEVKVAREETPIMRVD